jgi:hypothetical protein
MRIFLVLLFITLPYFSHAKDADWITRIEMKNMRTTDFVWLNSNGDIFWNTDLYANAMPCKSKVTNEDLLEFEALIHSIPRTKYEYQRDSNNQCKDGLRNDIYVSFKQANGSYEVIQNKFPSSAHCQVRKVDLSWVNLSKKLYIYTSEKFKECKEKVWR